MIVISITKLVIEMFNVIFSICPKKKHEPNLGLPKTKGIADLVYTEKKL